MDERLALVIGARVRAARATNHQTREVVAGLSGITTDYLYQIERGKKLPTIPVLAQLAEVLNVPVSRLLDKPEAPVRSRPSMIDAGMSLYRALTQPIVPHEPPPVAELPGRVRSAWQIWQTSPYRYSKLAHQLPVLITDTELAGQRHQSEDERSERRQVRCCAVDLYGLLRTVAKRVGRVDLSLLAADRAIRAAEALRLAEQVHHDRSPSIERRVAFLIEQAKGNTQQRDYASALVLLQAASREAPEV